jgi:2-methylcitrate dehydratase PrpD
MTYPRPRTGLEAKFSLPFVVAVAIADRQLRMAAFTDEAVRRPDLTALLDRVRPVNRDDSDDVVEVRLTDRAGRTHARRVRYARGDPRGGEPLSWDELLIKYRDCAGTALAAPALERSATLVADLDSRADLVELVELIGLLG